ncbi:M20/M25/M40 family metallo-hydrolase [Sediminicola luteus]|uniref:Acetylornithine deacetylase n=1 Tax=Sediminicola luteus TaxID=319238 RepID=A0A2A4GFW0_9FLAO|nr:M20/M25/M40 family metallo-hydrolase [Sediminicola luteus]PCE66622.1 acetylornithine deacetylase [Sediminicola luteus]
MKSGILFFCLGISILWAQPRYESDAQAASEKSLPLLRDFLSIANDALYPEQIEPNVVWCKAQFSQRGFHTQRIATSVSPLLLAQYIHDKKAPTVLVYLQIDGQPVDTTQWNQPNPYKPVLKKPTGQGGYEQIPWESAHKGYDEEWRVFARSASDAKGPVVMFLAALDVLAEKNLRPKFNIKVIMDFEEELGSPRLPQAVLDNRALLAADMMVIFDGPRHVSNQPTLLFGARGIATVGITTYGPIVPQHSGHFGNYAPNPALRMSKLLAGMKDEYGRVLLPGFYDGVSLTPETQSHLRAVPDNEDYIRQKLQIAAIDSVGSYYQESIQYPSLNIRGLQSGWVNEKSRTIVPAWAKAELDIRLVPESQPEILIEKVRSYIKAQGYFLTSKEPTREERLQFAKIARFEYEISYPAFRTDYDTGLGTWLFRSLKQTFGKPPVMIRMSGGSIPIAPFVNTLGIPAVGVPTVQKDNNQHSPNENLRLGNFKEGIQTMIGILLDKP